MQDFSSVVNLGVCKYFQDLCGSTCICTHIDIHVKLLKHWAWIMKIYSFKRKTDQTDYKNGWMFILFCYSSFRNSETECLNGSLQKIRNFKDELSSISCWGWKHLCSALVTRKFYPNQTFNFLGPVLNQKLAKYTCLYFLHLLTLLWTAVILCFWEGQTSCPSNMVKMRISSCFLFYVLFMVSEWMNLNSEIQFQALLEE